MNRADIEKRISEELMQQVAIQHQMEGLRRMHDSAVLLGNTVLANQYREHMHTALDAQLDSANANMMLARQLGSIPK